MNQVEIWLSILVRKLLQRGSFRSVTDLKQKVWDFIDYYNRTMAKPFKWTYQGKGWSHELPGYLRQPVLGKILSSALFLTLAGQFYLRLFARGPAG